MRGVAMLVALLGSGSWVEASAAGPAPVALGSRRELFVDTFLVDRLAGVRLELQTPRDEGVALAFDRPWEGPFSGYATVIRADDRFRVYYRGSARVGADGNPGEVCCCAESSDGKTWIRPELSLFEMQGARTNNVVLANAAPATHNFCPFLDARPGVAAPARFKALGGTAASGLLPYQSADGLRWSKLRDEPVLHRGNVGSNHIFDSQNVSFWSAVEGKYVCYFRIFDKGVRRIARCESSDFLNWSAPTLLAYSTPGGAAPIEHLYTNQTHPYFRAPHLYIAVAARFMPGRQVLDAEQAKAIRVDPAYFKDTSDAVLMSTRPVEGKSFAGRYERTFLEGFIRGGIGARNWVSRTNYPALNVVQTGPTEMSIYVNQDYAQPTAHLRRYSLRLDGFASARAGHRGGELVTRPFTFAGSRLSINFATSAAGGIRFEIQDSAGQPLPGLALADCVEQIGNEIEREVRWQSKTDLSRHAGKAVRMRVFIKDADLFSIRFD